MDKRLDYWKVAPQGYHALTAIDRYINDSSIETSLLELVKLRASQVNHCAFCIDMHWKDARAAGESEQRLYSLDGWREAPFYTDRECAALAWTESLTLVSETGAPDSVYEDVRAIFTDKEIVDLTLAISMINAWNRLSISMRAPVPGTYDPSLRHKLAPKPAEPAKSD
ncbi:MAG: carboxymuconolactone decarboxylase family protein [Chloroflexota bacterium]